MPEMFELPPDPITCSLIRDLAARSRRGMETYHTTLAREDFTLEEWLDYHYEELLDAAQYNRRLKAGFTPAELSRRHPLQPLHDPSLD